jgi:hypothetical protein
LKTALAIALALALGAQLIAVAAATSTVHRLRAMRKEYAPVPVTPRLAYEDRGSIAPAAALALSAEVVRDLDQRDLNRYNLAWRDQELARLHNRQYEKFIRAIGFGIGRMASIPSAEQLRRPPLRDIPFNWPLRGADAGPYRDWGDQYSMTERASIDFIHVASRDDFLHPEGFGAEVGADDLRAGFIPHAFHEQPTTVFADPKTWTLKRLELVSLLKFDEPRVYVLDHLPRMDQLTGDDVPTRPLDEFETAALAQLRTAQDVVIDAAATPLRMLGSLRAANECLDCHSVQRGELLGAFTYFLNPGATPPALPRLPTGR